MADNEHWYLEDEPKPNLYGWIFRQMTMGAAYAALACMFVLFVILVIRSVAFILPEDPFAAIEIGTRALSALV